MKPLVLMVVAVMIIRPDSAFTGQDRFMQLFQILTAHPSRGKTPAKGFKFGHHLEHLDHLGQARMAHKGTAMGQ